MARPFIQIDLNFFERTIELSDGAVLLTIKATAISGRLESDGIVTLAQIKATCPNDDDLLVHIEELIESGLWSRIDERTYLNLDYLKSHASHADLEAMREDRRKRAKQGGINSGKARAATPASTTTKRPGSTQTKQPASTTTKQASNHNKKKSNEIQSNEIQRTHPPASSQANSLAELAFSQSVKPTKGVKATANLFERLLNAGHSEEDIRVAIVTGVNVWTDNGVAYAISRSKQDDAPGTLTDVVEGAALAIEDWYRTPAPRDVSALPPLAQLAHEKLPASVLGGNIEVLCTRLRQLATSKAAS